MTRYLIKAMAEVAKSAPPLASIPARHGLVLAAAAAQAAGDKLVAHGKPAAHLRPRGTRS